MDLRCSVFGEWDLYGIGICMVHKYGDKNVDKPVKTGKASARVTKDLENGFSYLNGFAVYCIILNYW